MVKLTINPVTDPVPKTSSHHFHKHWLDGRFMLYTDNGRGSLKNDERSQNEK